jgi:hypothetical protein
MKAMSTNRKQINSSQLGVNTCQTLIITTTQRNHQTIIAAMLLSNALLVAFASLAASSPIFELFSKQAVSCLQLGASATARWTNSAGKQCTYTGIVGSNYGANPSGSGEYVNLKRPDRLHRLTVLQLFV